MTDEHAVSVLDMGTPLNPVHQAVCSCGWESENLHTRRPGAVRDARKHGRVDT